jgi:hypothetical protein
MTSTQSPPSPLIGDQLVELLALVKDADSVELKLTVPESGRRSAITALALDPLEVQIRQVFFFDTPDLMLNQNGLVVRARRSQNAPDDSVVKLRPVVPGELPAKLRALPDFGVEVDAMPTGFVCSASFKAKLTEPRVRETVAGKRPIRKLFTKQQRAFLADHAPDGIELDALTVLGPIPVFKLKFSPVGFGRRLVVELWNYPDGSRILELSTKCLPSETVQVAAEGRAFLIERGVSLTGEQATKTASALRFFSEELHAEG